MITYYNMNLHPVRAVDLSGNKLDFSIPVLVYDAEDPSYCEIGHYNFDIKEWEHFGDVSMKLICWCNTPNASTFVNENRKNLPIELHIGYRP